MNTILRGRIRVWKSQVIPYLKEASKRVIWRIEGLGYSEEDFMQEAFFVYERCLEKYGSVLDDKGRLSPIFKTCINNFIVDLSNDSSKKNSFIDKTELIEELSEDRFTVYDNDGYLNLIIKEAPKEVLDVLFLVFSTPIELLEEVSYFVNKKHSKGFKSNKFLCKMLGYDPFKYNLVKITKNYFQ